MEVNDFTSITSFKGANGTELGYNRVLSGSTFNTIQSAVTEFDLKDWKPVFNPDRLSKFNLVMGYKATVTANLSNAVAIGNLVNPTNSNTLQLGWVDQDICVLDDIYVRNDSRDINNLGEADNLEDHLNFINEIKPIKYQLAVREKSLEELYPYPHPLTEPDMPIVEQYNGDTDAYMKAIVTFLDKKEKYDAYIEEVNNVYNTRKAAYSTLTSTPKSDTRYGFDNDNLNQAITTLDPNFKPILDHSGEGFDVKYLRSNFLNVSLVNAIKELTKLHKKLREDHDVLRLEHDQLKIDFDALVLEKETMATDITTIKTTLGLP